MGFDKVTGDGPLLGLVKMPSPRYLYGLTMRIKCERDVGYRVQRYRRICREFPDGHEGLG